MRGDSKFSCVVLIFHNNSFNTGAWEWWCTVEIVHHNGQVMLWGLLFHEGVGAVFQEIKSYSTERDVVWVSVELTATWKRSDEELIFCSMQNTVINLETNIL